MNKCLLWGVTWHRWHHWGGAKGGHWGGHRCPWKHLLLLAITVAQLSLVLTVLCIFCVFNADRQAWCPFVSLKSENINNSNCGLLHNNSNGWDFPSLVIQTKLYSDTDKVKKRGEARRTKSETKNLWLTSGGSRQRRLIAWSALSFWISLISWHFLDESLQSSTAHRTTWRPPAGGL